MTADDALDRLYTAPLEVFVTVRGALAAELRASGNVAGARDILMAKKPSRTSWALNQVARRYPEALRAAMGAHAAATRAQLGADGEAMRETARAFRDRLGDVIKRCAETLADAGANLSPSQARRLGETLRAAVSEPGEQHQRLLAGRLVDDVEIDRAFANLPEGSGSPVREGDVKSKAGAPAGARALEAEQARDAQRAREARDRAIAEARRNVEALEEEAREARDAAQQAELAASRARAEADRLKRVVVRAEERLASAREALGKL
jgi:hypothetical protein